MKTPPLKSTAEQRVVRRFNNLFAPLVELCDAVRDLEPYGMIVDDIVLSNSGEGVHLEYKTKPVMVTIIDKDKRMVLQVSRGGERKN